MTQTLKQARKDKNFERFINEHENDVPGDTEKLDEALKKPVSQKSKEAPKASSRRGSGD